MKTNCRKSTGADTGARGQGEVVSYGHEDSPSLDDISPEHTGATHVACKPEHIGKHTWIDIAAVGAAGCACVYMIALGAWHALLWLIGNS